MCDEKQPQYIFLVMVAVFCCQQHFTHALFLLNACDLAVGHSLLLSVLLC